MEKIHLLITRRGDVWRVRILSGGVIRWRTASRSTRRRRPWSGGAWRGYPAGEKMKATTTTTPMAIKRLVSMVGLFGFGGSAGGR